MNQIDYQTCMGFDFGTKSIGVAIGQRVTYTARALQSIKAQDGIPNWELLQKLFDEWQPDLIVVGLPLNMDGSEQEMTQRAKKFANRLHGRFGKRVELYDERLSTADARQKLFEHGGYRVLEKGRVDSMSAQLILESWMENNL